MSGHAGSQPCRSLDDESPRKRLSVSLRQGESKRLCVVPPLVDRWLTHASCQRKIAIMAPLYGAYRVRGLVKVGAAAVLVEAKRAA